MPHAPVLLETIQPSLDEGRRIRKAVDELDLSGADALVLVSAHGRLAGVYEQPVGALRGFGIDGLEAERPTDAGLVRALSDAWGNECIGGPADFGVVVPLLLGVGEDVPVISVALPETTGPRATEMTESLRAGRSLAEALQKVAGELDVAVVASAHASAGLTDRAPLTKLFGAAELDREVVVALEEDPALVEGLLQRLHETGRACGVGPLAVMARLFGGWKCRDVTYEAPYGVGYLVAELAR